MTPTVETRDRSRLALLLDIAHRLRTPAGVISGYVEMLHDGDIPLEAALPALESQVAELLTTLDAMLDEASTSLEAQERWSARLRTARENNDRILAETRRLVERSSRLVRTRPNLERPPKASRASF
jgi:signal transduction histidine kinase